MIKTKEEMKDAIRILSEFNIKSISVNSNIKTSDEDDEYTTYCNAYIATDALETYKDVAEHIDLSKIDNEPYYFTFNGKYVVDEQNEQHIFEDLPLYRFNK